MNKIAIKILVLCLLCTFNILAQREKGRIKKTNIIKPNNPYYKENEKKKDDYDYDESDLPKQILDRNYQEEKVPTKNSNEYSIVSIIDTTSSHAITPVAEGQKDIVEISEEVQLGESSEDWVQIAQYFSIWDERNVDPYDIKPDEFDGPVILNLVNKEDGHYSSAPLNETKVTSKFGYRGNRGHYGVDLALKMYDPVYTTFDGIVRISGYNGGGWGNYVVVRHYNGLETLYGHLTKSEVEPNTLVKAGDLIGLGGSTGRSSGPHLHLETRYEGNPIDPSDIFVFPIGELKTDQLLLTNDSFKFARSKVQSEYSGGQKVTYRQPVWIRVKPGDTLYAIASRYNIGASELARKNKISLNGNLVSGRKLRVK